MLQQPTIAPVPYKKGSRTSPKSAQVSIDKFTSKTCSAKLSLNTKLETSLHKTVPLSPLKRLSLLTTSVGEPTQVIGSPKGRKMQRTSSESKESTKLQDEELKIAL